RDRIGEIPGAAMAERPPRAPARTPGRARWRPAAPRGRRSALRRALRRDVTRLALCLRPGSAAEERREPVRYRRVAGYGHLRPERLAAGLVATVLGLQRALRPGKGVCCDLFVQRPGLRGGSSDVPAVHGEFGHLMTDAVG